MGYSVIFVLTSILIVGVTAQKPCAAVVFETIDKDSSGYIDVDEFKLCFTEKGKKDIDRNEFMKAIKDHKFETCGLDPAYVFKFLSKKQNIMHLEEIFWQEYDSNADKTISLDEFQSEHYNIFVKWMSENIVSFGGF
ncbi:uncharacterized protein LOC110450111 [Mizuhopecten yessoensis]|uniref:EF-hand domain-containing protein n=1 Tax=Mizuhopecten yessoensis TaxID=6573 RepID=A0A210QPT6_MIZYE|nr:uncharacterized protein LOC110450111 [Mizuhopecten yessoensis]OWF50708.1 hypothetical protein KP79_PYT18344 [Mizuhopecten yessoensis]